MTVKNYTDFVSLFIVESYITFHNSVTDVFFLPSTPQPPHRVVFLYWASVPWEGFYTFLHTCVVVRDLSLLSKKLSRWRNSFHWKKMWFLCNFVDHQSLSWIWSLAGHDLWPLLMKSPPETSFILYHVGIAIITVLRACPCRPERDRTNAWRTLGAACWGSQDRDCFYPQCL